MHLINCVDRISRLYGLVLLALVLTVTGCASTSDTGYKVAINSKNQSEASDHLNQKNLGIDNQDTSRIDPFIKYGSEKNLKTPAKRKYSTKKGSYSLDFVNISVEDFVSIVFNEMLETNYLLDNSIKGNVTVQTRGLLNASQLLSIVDSVLATKNAVLITYPNRYELIPLAKAKNYSFKPELYSARNLKPGYRMVIVPVKHINPEDLKPILESVSPAAGHLKIDKARRVVVVTGTEQEISNVVDAVQIFDVSWLVTKSIALLPMLNAEASDVKNEISKILTSQNKTHEIVLDTFSRFNALLVVAEKKEELDFVRNWVSVLDVRVPTEDTQLFVYDVQNRKASELADMLNSIFGEDSGSIIKSKSDSQSTTASTKEIVVTNKKEQKKTGPKANKNTPLKIVADETNNAILIMANDSQYKSIISAIEDLDVLPLQVLIEVSIVELTLTDELSYGLEWFLKHNGVGGGKFDSSTTLDVNAGSGIGAIAPGLSFLLSGSGSLVQTVFNTLAAESKLNVISSPSLMALDNHTATIRVGDQQPIQVSAARSTNNDVLTQSIEFKNTGVLLSVTPRVNSGGLVTMELSQEVTDIGGIDDATGQRSFLQRNINSTVAVQDGRTIILGGLITENTVESESGVPGLHNLPFIGALFGKTSKAKIKRELIVLITPKVIYDHNNASKITEEYAEKMQLLKDSLIISE